MTECDSRIATLERYERKGIISDAERRELSRLRLQAHMGEYLLGAFVMGAAVYLMARVLMP